VRPEAALFLFHLRVGTRVALRILAPVLAAALFLFYVLRPEFALELARILFVEGSLVESGLAGTLLLVGLARVVAPRVSAGGRGWARSLPVAGTALRLLTVLSMVVAEIPILAFLGALVLAATRPGLAGAAIRVAGLVVGAAAAGLACLPAPTALGARLLPAAACFFSFSGSWPLLGASAVILIISGALPGRVPVSRKRYGTRRDLPEAAFFQGLALRSVRGRVIFAYLSPAIILGAARLFLSNNDLAADRASAFALFALALGLASFVGAAADILATRRPAWPWLRSLPRSAAARVRDDAIFLAVSALPLAGGLALLGRPAREAILLVGPLAWLAIRGAGAMREFGDRAFGVIGQLAVEGTIISLTLALLPWTSWLLAAASPYAFILARNAERRLKPTRWAERHHSDAGDPLSWSAS
jgi:hypothetical protein